MSVGSNLQEMENVVTKGAAPAEPMPAAGSNASGIMAPGQTGSWEDLGGPTPQNYRPDDNSAQLRTPGATLAQVKDVVNKNAAPADPMPGAVKEDEDLDDEELIAEAEHDEEKDEPPHKEGKNEKGEEKEGKHHEKGEKKEDEVEEEYEVEDDFNIEEDVNALLEGEELSEEFQEKARTIFEAAIRSKVNAIKEDLEAQYEATLVEELESIKESLVERVDAYLEYVADEWIQENALAVEAGLQSEISESFMTGLKGLFEDHYVSIPEEKYDVIESMVDKLDEMEAKLNEQIEKNVALNKRLAESVSDVIFSDVAEGLALSQKDKLASLAENVEFEGEANYREKLVTLRESYFPTRTAGTQVRNQSENLSEEVDFSTNTDAVGGVMSTYLQTLQRVSRK
jgi:hypothetical protein